jgi:hypothetical protein
MIEGDYVRNWRTGGYTVRLWHDLPGTVLPGLVPWHRGGIASGLHASAPAVIDDFGNLALVGGWK